MKEPRSYIAIDLKSFYASVECVERGLDPLTTNLVVADNSRTEKTICLAVSPSLKAYGIGGRARLFEVTQRLREVNHARRMQIPGQRLERKSVDATALKANPRLEVDTLIAMPRMAYYIEYSTRIYQIYLRYLAPEDIHAYSIDEVFCDVTAYLKTYRMTAHQLAMRMIRDVLQETGITATAGIGTNLYLSKIAMDIVAKKMPADADGVRIAELDEMSYRRQLWSHRPLTDFWRIGKGLARRLEAYGIHTMGQLARKSLTHEVMLHQLFGVNAELLIDHAWGWEPCTVADIKAYRPENHSLCSGQVLQSAYKTAQARIVVKEMADSMALDLVDKGLVTSRLTLTIGYDTESLRDPTVSAAHKDNIITDSYGRQLPKPTHGTTKLAFATSSSQLITAAVMDIFDKIVHTDLLVRKLNLTAHEVVGEEEAEAAEKRPVQLNLFADTQQLIEERRQKREELAKEHKMQHALLNIKKKFGKNAILKGTDFEEGATAKERNNQIGGHKA